MQAAFGVVPLTTRPIMTLFFVEKVSDKLLPVRPPEPESLAEKDDAALFAERVGAALIVTGVRVVPNAVLADSKPAPNTELSS